MPMEETLIVLKGDAVQRRLTGQIIDRLERKGLRIVGMKMLQVDRPLAELMYEPHRGKDFYEPLLTFITSAPVVAMVMRGQGVISVVRQMMGATFGPDAEVGTIRGDFGMSRRYNLIHGSDSPESAAREIPLFFTPREIMTYDSAEEDRWVYARQDGRLL